MKTSTKKNQRKKLKPSPQKNAPCVSGQRWSALTGSTQAFIVGLANGHHRYLPMPAHFDEPDAALHYETVTAGLAPNAMRLALDAATEML